MYYIERYRLGKMVALYGPYGERVDAEALWRKARKVYDQDHIVLTSSVAEYVSHHSIREELKYTED